MSVYTRTGRRLVLTFLLPGIVASYVVFAPTAGMASSRYTAPTLSVVVSGSSVTAQTVIRAAQRTTAAYAGICSRDASGGNRDFPFDRNVTLTPAGTSFSKTQALPEGAYSYWACARIGNQWTNSIGYVQTFVVTATPPIQTTMPHGDLPGWRQVFTDDFVTPIPMGSFPGAVSDRWVAYKDGWRDTSGNGTYYPSKVLSVHDGYLDMNIHSENGVHMVAAPWPKLPQASANGGMQYGRYAVRFRADSLKGYKTAWLHWPDSGVYPRDGGLDFPEGDLDGTISAFMHRQDGSSGGDQDAYNTSVPFTGWHVAVTEWSPGRAEFFLDGISIGASTTRVPNTAMRYVLQTETTLDGTTPRDDVAGHVQIDWVAIYSLAS